MGNGLLGFLLRREKQKPDRNCYFETLIKKKPMSVCQLALPCFNTVVTRTDKSDSIALPGQGFSCRLFPSAESASVLWESVAPGHNAFLGLSYLRVVERHSPEGVTPFYLVFVREDQPVGIAYFQLVDFRADQSLQSSAPQGFFPRLAYDLKQKALGLLRLRLLHLGNVLLTGPRGFYFLPDISQEEANALLANALSHAARRLEKEHGYIINSYLVKDLPASQQAAQRVWLDKGFEELCFFPNMVLHLSPEWRQFDDYLNSLHSKYRVRARRAFRLLDGVRTRELSLEEIRHREGELYGLYQQVAASVEFNMATLDPEYFFGLKEEMGDAFHLIGYFLEGRLLGFYSTIENGEELEAHFMGFDQQYNRDYQLYLNMLFDMIGMGIGLGVRYISFARTAMEIKSSVGAVAEDLKCYIRHRSPVVHALIRPLVKWLQPSLEWEPRHPFK